MPDCVSTVSVPQELLSYSQNKIVDCSNPVTLELISEIIRNENGTIASIRYYNSGLLSKEVFYEWDEISKINIYTKGKLQSSVKYYNSFLLQKISYDVNSGEEKTFVKFEYNKRDKITSITKRVNSRTINAKYVYDDLERIIERSFYVNSEKVATQSYKYDILNRIIEYSDDTKTIVVNKMSKLNELISYTITDNINNETLVENCFNGSEYIYTKLSTASETTSVKDYSYVGSVIMQKPVSREDDLDFVLANLLNNYSANVRTKKKSSIENSERMLDVNIQNRVLPISIRKRIMYNIALNNC